MKKDITPDVFADLDLAALDAFDVEVVEASSGSARVEGAASCLHWIYSCSCSVREA